MATTEKDLFGWYPLEKMYNDNNRPSKTELEDMKEKLLIELEKLL